MIRRVVLVASACALLVVLAGCATDPTPAPRPSVKRTLVFESKNAALTEARAVYEQYARASDKAAAAGGANIEQLAPFVTPDELAAERKSAAYLVDHKLRVVGPSKLIAFLLQNADLTVGTVQAYVCVDVSKTRVFDAKGSDVTPDSRKDRQTSVARFVWRGDRLLLDGTSPWSGDPIC